MQQGRISKRSAVAWTVVSVWLAGTAYAFWSFELKQQRPFESARTVLFDSGARARSAEIWFREAVAPQLGGTGARLATVVHVYAANCPCNRFNASAPRANRLRDTNIAESVSSRRCRGRQPPRPT